MPTRCSVITQPQHKPTNMLTSACWFLRCNQCCVPIFFRPKRSKQKTTVAVHSLTIVVTSHAWSFPLCWWRKADDKSWVAAYCAAPGEVPVSRESRCQASFVLFLAMCTVPPLTENSGRGHLPDHQTCLGCTYLCPFCSPLIAASLLHLLLSTRKTQLSHPT